MVVEGFQSSPGLTRAPGLTRLRLAAGPASLGEASEALTYREDVAIGKWWLHPKTDFTFLLLNYKTFNM